MVSRGPQAVQLMNGCRYRRSPGSNSSFSHFGQVAMSGDTKMSPLTFSLWMIRKGLSVSASAPSEVSTTAPPANCSSMVRSNSEESISVVSIFKMLERSGASPVNRRSKSETCVSVPPTNTSTYGPLLQTLPRTPLFSAINAMNGRKPTP